MTALKPGDRVEYTAGHHSYAQSQYKGKQGTFVGYTETGSVQVDWDDKSRDGPGSGAKFPANVGLIEEPKKPEVSQDPEVAAIVAVLAAISDLPASGRNRVLTYVTARPQIR